MPSPSSLLLPSGAQALSSQLCSSPRFSIQPCLTAQPGQAASALPLHCLPQNASHTSINKGQVPSLWPWGCQMKAYTISTVKARASAISTALGPVACTWQVPHNPCRMHQNLQLQSHLQLLPGDTDCVIPSSPAAVTSNTQVP